MLSVVYDTNIYISGILLRGQITKLFEISKEIFFNIYISPHIIAEIRKVMTSKFHTPLPIQKVIIRRIKSIATITHPTTRPKIIPNHHPDNQILATCASCDADYLVTGDKKHILPLKKFGDTKIITASDFLAILKK